MLIVHHRINQIGQLNSVPAGDGVEVDLRTSGQDVILNHEPFGHGDRLEEYLDAYGPARKGPLVLNVKEDLLEERVTALCRDRRIENFFFLDCAFPTLVRLVRAGFSKLALRVSEYEPVEIARAFSGRIEWAWLDCFDGKPSDTTLIRDVQNLGYRVCLVSPELQGFGGALNEHLPLRTALRSNVDAVCTKFADRWSQA